MDLQSAVAFWAARGTTGATTDASRAAAPSARYGVVMDELLTRWKQRTYVIPARSPSQRVGSPVRRRTGADRKSTRLNSSHKRKWCGGVCSTQKKRSEEHTSELQSRVD